MNALSEWLEVEIKRDGANRGRGLQARALKQMVHASTSADVAAQAAEAWSTASRPDLRLTPHSSGPVWIASPSPYDSFIRYTSPLIPALPPCLAFERPRIQLSRPPSLPRAEELLSRPVEFPS